jgi:hypothetical protein
MIKTIGVVVLFAIACYMTLVTIGNQPYEVKTPMYRMSVERVNY